MSVEIDSPVAPQAPAVGGSLRDRAAARREELQRQDTFKLPVEGWEDMLLAEYRGLGYTMLRKIGERHDQGTPEGELASFADTLINACVDIYEITPDGPVAFGKRWSSSFVRDELGIDLPDSATARQALEAVLPEDYLAMHFRAYDMKVGELLTKHDRAVVGESGASSALV